MVRTLNLVLYELGWFACVLSAAYLRPWLGISIGLALIGVHLYLTTDRANQAKVILFTLATGMCVDSVLLGLGVYQFPSGSFSRFLPPLWMSVLWMQFATTFRYSLSWLSGRHALSAVLGFMGAPLAFLGGEKLGAITFDTPRQTNLLILGAFWGLAIPLLFYVSDRIHARATCTSSYRGFTPHSG